MAITVPQWIKANSASTASFTSNTTTGNTLVACITYASTTVTVATCKTAGNTFTQAVAILAGNATGGSSELWYVSNCVGETTPTVTLTWSAAAPSPITIDLFELHGSVGVAQLDLSSSGANRAVAISVTSMTPSGPNEIVIACARCSGTMSTATFANTDLVTPAIRSEYTIQTTATAVTSIGTDSASSTWNEAVSACFKEVPFNIAPSGIASTNAFGTAVVQGTAIIASGIASTNVFGPAVVRGTAITALQWIKSNSGSTASYTANIAAGNTLVACITQNTGTVTAVATPGNTFTKAISFSPPSTQNLDIWYKSNCVGETAPTVTVTVTVSGTAAIDLLELSSLNNLIEFDKTTSGGQTSGVISVTSMTPSLANEIVVACACSFPASITSGSFSNVNLAVAQIRSEYTVQTTPTAITSLGNLGASSPNGGIAAAFKITALITPSGIASTATFGTATVALDTSGANISPAGIPSTIAFGTSALAPGSVDISPTGMVSTTVFGTTALLATYSLSPTGIVSTNAFGTALVAPGVVSITPSGIASTNVFGTASIVPGSVNITPSGIASTNAFGTASISIAQSIAPTGIASTTAFGTASVVPGSISIAPLGIVSTTAFGTATVAPGAVSITPSGVASTNAFGTASVSPGPINIAPNGISSTTAFGTAIIGRGAVSISPAGIASTTVFGIPLVVAVIAGNIAPAGIVSTTVFGTATLHPGTVNISPSGIASTTTCGTATVSASVNIAPSGIASITVFGVTTVSLGGALQSITATGIASTNAFGNLRLLTSFPVLVISVN